MSATEYRPGFDRSGVSDHIGLHSTTIHVRGTNTAAIECGHPAGPLALFLHGFPDTAHTWRHLMPHLAAHGYRAVAPTLRGYAPTSAGARTSVTAAELVADVTAMHAALGGDERAVLIGHDWGASVAYGAANHSPGSWSRLITSAVPPTGSNQIDFLSLGQMQRSWYAFLLALPGGPEIAWRTELLATLWRLWSPDHAADDELAALHQALPTQEQLHQVAGLYRNALGAEATPSQFAAEDRALVAPVQVPTLYLHGAADGCIDPALADHALRYLPDGSRVLVLPDIGHFPHLEAPTAVIDAVDSFLGLPPPAQP